MNRLTIEILSQDFSVCKVKDYEDVNLNEPFVFTGKTDSECSLVCPTPMVPTSSFAREDGWIALRVMGTLDFSLIGILADISTRLAQHGISIFALSTFDTDYILIKKEKKDKAVEALKEQYTCV